VEAYYDRGYAYSKLRHNKEAAKDLNYYLKIGGNKQPNAELVREEIKRLGYNPEY
jgi:regulator of sirC expression with transglutaminase-like and TPR domain